METKVTEAELVENLHSILDRVGTGEQFIVVRDGEEIAVLSQLRPGLTGAVQGMAERLKNLATPDESDQAAPAPAGS